MHGTRIVPKNRTEAWKIDSEYYTNDLTFVPFSKEKCLNEALNVKNQKKMHWMIDDFFSPKFSISITFLKLLLLFFHRHEITSAILN